MPKRSSAVRCRVMGCALLVVLSGCASTPRSVSTSEVEQRAAADLGSLFAEAPNSNALISLPEAIARALKYNLDNRLKMLETVASQQRLQIADYQKLPQLAASAGYDVRDTRSASSSLNLTSGVPNFGASTSQDKGLLNTALRASWNTLDFGIAYHNTRQAGNEALIALERQRRVLQNIVRDVRYAYWRVAAAEPLQQTINALLIEIRQGLNDSYAAQQAKLKPLEECLEYQRALLDLQRQMMILQREAADARVELTALIGLAPFTEYKVARSERYAVPPVSLEPSEIRKLQHMALLNRPELIEEDYKRRNALEEVKKTRLKMIPGLELFTGYNSNDNSFLLHNNWTSAGYQVTWNLMNLISGPKQLANAKTDVEIADLRRRALSVAVLTQVDIAAYQLYQSKQELGIAKELYRVDNGMYEQYVKQLQAEQIDQLTMLQAKARRLVSALRYSMSLAEWQNSTGVLYNSVGYQPATTLNSQLELEALTSQVESYLITKPFQENPHFRLPTLAKR